MVRTFASNRVEEIDTAEGAGDDGVDLAARTLDPQLRVAAHMREYVLLAQLNQSQLGVVAVSKEVCGIVSLELPCIGAVVRSHTLETVQAGAHEAQGLVELVLVPGAAIGAAQLDAPGEETADVLCRGHDAGIFVGNVVLHARLLVDGELD
jgi:hypothetical protein